MSTQKKNTTKKPVAKKSSSKGTKRVTKRNPVKKGKVTVSPLGLFMLCGSILICCLCLLLLTTVMERRPPVETDVSSSVLEKETEKKSQPKPNESFKETHPDEKKNIAKNSVSNAGSDKTNVNKSNSQVKSSQNTSEKSSVKNTQNIQKKNNAGTDVSGGVAKTPERSEGLKQAPDPKTVSMAKPSEGGHPKKENFDFPQAVNGAQLVILLDDGGQNLDDLQKFLSLPIPLSVAVLPKLRDSVSSAESVRLSGNELLLHQPMQAVNLSVNPGPGAIKPEMSVSEIRALMQENLREVGPVSGINNHEGSLITADALKVESIIDVAHMNGLYILDSRTNAETKIPYVSREMGYGWYERNGFFLDNPKTRDEFLKELRKNLDIANKTGYVIMIAHVWSANYMPALIREVLPELKEKGYTFTTVGKSRGLRN